MGQVGDEHLPITRANRIFNLVASLQGLGSIFESLATSLFSYSICPPRK